VSFDSYCTAGSSRPSGNIALLNVWIDQSPLLSKLTVLHLLSLLLRWLDVDIRRIHGCHHGENKHWTHRRARHLQGQGLQGLASLTQHPRLDRGPGNGAILKKVGFTQPAVAQDTDTSPFSFYINRLAKRLRTCLCSMPIFSRASSTSLMAMN